VDPFTVIGVFVMQKGVESVVAALGGDPALQGLASQLVGELSGSESGVGERLSRIEGTLHKLVGQPYKAGIEAGLRKLEDALAPVPDPNERRAELEKAGDYFTQAAANAGDALQRAIAERYRLLCGICLGKQGAADNARSHFYAAITQAVLDLDETRWSTTQQSGKPFEWGDRVVNPLHNRKLAKLIPILEEQEHVKGLLGDILHEVDLLSGRAGPARPRVLFVNPVFQGMEAWNSQLAPLWRSAVIPRSFRPPQVFRFGSLTVDWRESRPVGAGSVVDNTSWPMVDVDIEIQAEPVLNRDLPVRLIGVLDQYLGINSHLADEALNCRTALPAGESKLQIRRRGRVTGSLDLTVGHYALKLSPDLSSL